MENWIPFLSFVLVASFTPGPNNIISMSIANGFGFRKAHKFNIGVALGFGILILICCYFNVLLFNIVPKIKLFIGILGAIYMVYLAFKIIMSKPDSSENENKKQYSFFSGVAMQFINPKGILYAISVVSVFIIPFNHSNMNILLYSTFLGFIAFLSTSTWSLFGLFFQRFLRKYKKPFDVVMGLILIYCAISTFV